MTSEDPVFRVRLTAYLDDQLSPAEAREFLALLERDPVAMRRLEEARRVWALLGAYRDEPVPDGFAEGVLAKTRGDAATGFAPGSADAEPAACACSPAGGRAAPWRRPRRSWP